MELPRPIEQLRIVLYPDPVLRVRCAPIDVFDEQLAAIADQMLELMHEARGVGLAAPQVGLPHRLFVCNATGEPEDDAVWINPTLSDLEGSEEAEEGCLSIPGVNVPKRRATQLTIEGVDLTGQAIRSRTEDLLARVMQHENDHLDGRLVIDNMSQTDELANRRTIQELEARFVGVRR